MPTSSQNKKTTPEPEIRDSIGIGNSSVKSQKGGSKAASPAELALALEASQKRVAQLEREALNRSSGDSQIAQLVEALTANLKQPTRTVVPNTENLNRSSDFQNHVDGTSMIEAQQTCARFRTEPKVPINIPKAISNFVGPNLVITVNGVRVSIPCDGQTHFVNMSHWEHARERLAKLDLLNSKDPVQVVIMGE